MRPFEVINSSHTFHGNLDLAYNGWNCQRLKGDWWILKSITILGRTPVANRPHQRQDQCPTPEMKDENELPVTWKIGITDKKTIGGFAICL